MEMKRVVID